MKKHRSLISAILILTCAQFIASPAYSATGTSLPDPCPCTGNYTRVEVFYAGENNAQIAIFSNSDLSPASLITSFPAVNSGQTLLIDGAALPGGALPVKTYLRVTNAAAQVNTIQLYTRCPSEAYPGASEVQKILGKTFGPFTVFAVTDQGNSYRCAIDNAEQDWRIGGNLVGSANNRLGTLNNEPLIFMTNNQTRGVITGSGNFGLGTTTPAARLDVSGNGFFRQNGNALSLVGQNHSFLELQPDGAPKATMGFAAPGATELEIKNTFTAGNVSLNAANGVGNVLLKGKSVGIGTNTPDEDAKLHIVGKALRLSGDPLGYDRYLDFRTDGLNLNMGTTGADLSIRAREGRKIFLNAEWNDGGVGIGTYTIPNNYRLAVDGKVICEELRVRNSDAWPDYVFEKQYALLPLEELENYVKAFKHLPGIPTAYSIEAEGGFDIGEMQRKLVEKIEELTLYTIDLNAENKALKEQLEQTNAQMAEIVKRLGQLEQK